MNGTPLLDESAGAPRSKNFPFRPFRNHNHNVVVNWLVRGFAGCADSVWSGTVLASYLYELFGSNRYAGYVEAAMGTTNLLVALPVGCIADRGSKASVSRVGGLLVPLAVGFTSFAVAYGVAHQEGARGSIVFPLLVASMCSWGMVQAIANGPAQALYADSVSTGERSRYYLISYSTYLIASMVGPLVCIVLFLSYGDHWRLETLRDVFIVGMGLELFVGAAMCCFRDRAALKEPVAATATRAPAAVAPAAAQPAAEEEAAAGKAGGPDLAPLGHVHPLAHLVPYVLFSSSLLSGLASGMTIKFFPLYFKNTCRMSPAGVQAVYTALPLLMAGFSNLVVRLSRRFGRIQAIISAKTVGISLLVLMARIEPWLLEGTANATSNATAADGPGTEPYYLRGAPPGLGEASAAPPSWKVGVIIAIYLARTCTMNCAYPLNTSIMMDFTPSRRRARWQSLTSVVKFGWCGSAALGGVLADQYGYAFTFLITAAVQLAGMVVQLFLLPIVPMREAAAGAAPPPQLRPAPTCGSLSLPNGAVQGGGRGPDGPGSPGSIQGGAAPLRRSNKT